MFTRPEYLQLRYVRTMINFWVYFSEGIFLWSTGQLNTMLIVISPTTLMICDQRGLQSGKHRTMQYFWVSRLDPLSHALINKTSFFLNLA